MAIARRLDQPYTLIHPRIISRRQTPEQVVRDLGDEPTMKILPKRGVFEERIHAGKDAGHDGLLYQQSRSAERLSRKKQENGAKKPETQIEPRNL